MKDKMYGYVYLVTNLINQKKYVGQHKSSNFDEQYLGSGKLLWQAYKKYGIENFEIEVLEWCKNQQELGMKEIYWIKTLNTFARNRKGYNICPGGIWGDTWTGTTEEERKIRGDLISKRLKGIKRPEHSKIMAGENNPMSNVNLNDILSDEANLEWRRKLSKSSSGKNNPMYGKSLLNILSEEKILLWKQRQGGRPSKNRKPCRIIFNDEILEFEFRGQLQEYVKKEFGISRSLCLTLLGTGNPYNPASKDRKHLSGMILEFIGGKNE